MMKVNQHKNFVWHLHHFLSCIQDSRVFWEPTSLSCQYWWARVSTNISASNSSSTFSYYTSKVFSASAALLATDKETNTSSTQQCQQQYSILLGFHLQLISKNYSSLISLLYALINISYIDLLFFIDKVMNEMCHYFLLLLILPISFRIWVYFSNRYDV